HSPAPSLGHSDVVSTQEAAIQFKMVNVAGSVIADVGAGSVLRQLCGGLLPMAVSSSRTAASSISALTLSTPFSICFIDRIGRSDSELAYRDTATQVSTLIDIARQAHYARLTVSGFAVTFRPPGWAP
ncbi:hypothetical protein, partial [Paraburkholderia sediminicola]|uniref:hypothetical protein n=1 Tax=Paraburkholderia sediminicola TaxID=458836 RepID=UPI0038BD6EB5